MKTTYLINKTQPDDTVRLSVATFEEWLAIVKANKSLPSSQQRYFVIDCIADNLDIDRIVIESSAEEYREWNKNRMASTRNRILGKKYQVLSLDSPVCVKNTMLDLKEVLKSGELVEEQVCFHMLELQLREALASWKPWATDMLDCYLRGERRSCTDILSKKYEVSPQVIRKYKRQFEIFVKDFLTVFRFSGDLCN